MKKISLALLVCCLATSGTAQLRGTTIDESTGSPIPYINIWVEGGTVGTTSDHSGKFEIPDQISTDSLVFSATGYLSKKIIASQALEKVALQKNIIALRDLKLRNKKFKSIEVKIGSFTPKNIDMYWGSSNRPYQVGRFFPYHDSLARSPFLKKITMYLSSFVSGAIAKVRLYEANDLG